MSQSVTVVFSAKDLDTSAISLKYKGEEIHLNFANTAKLNQILSSTDDEIPELVRVQTTVNLGSTLEPTPVKPLALPTFLTPPIERKLATPNAPSQSFVKHEVYCTPLETPAFPPVQSQVDHKSPPTPASIARATSDLVHDEPIKTIPAQSHQAAGPQSPIRDFIFSPLAPKLPRTQVMRFMSSHQQAATHVQQEDQIHKPTRVQQFMHNTKPVPIQHDFQTTTPTAFKIEPSVWKEELELSSKQVKRFDGRSFKKCDPNSQTGKAKGVTLAKIYQQIGSQDLWSCVPLECHASPRGVVPEDCGLPFLQHILRSVVATKKAGF